MDQQSNRHTTLIAEGGHHVDQHGSPRDARDTHALISILEPAIIRECDDRLSDIRAFRTNWQRGWERGGAATARAIFTDDTGYAHDVIVKVPVGRTELRWMKHLQTGDPDQVVPRLLASGHQLGIYDICWIVIEALPFGPMASNWTDAFVPRLAHAAARFYVATSKFKADSVLPHEDWETLLDQSAAAVMTRTIPERHRWLAALKAMKTQLPCLETSWRSRDMSQWLHGDVHPRNCMWRGPGEDSPAILIDLAEVRAGHWVEDAVYLERLFWSQPEQLRAYEPVEEWARAVRSGGLTVGDDYRQLAALQRALLAAITPRSMSSSACSPADLQACLERLEAFLRALTGTAAPNGV